MPCCPDRPSLPALAAVFSCLETLELLRLALVTPWLGVGVRWDKAVLLEIALLLLLLVTELLLYCGARRRSTAELAAWLATHGLAAALQAGLLLYWLVQLVMLASPAATDQLGLPSGMRSGSPEFLQALRYRLWVTAGWLAGLATALPLYSLGCRAVWHARAELLAEAERARAKYEVQAEYRDIRTEVPLFCLKH